MGLGLGYDSSSDEDGGAGPAVAMSVPAPTSTTEPAAVGLVAYSGEGEEDEDRVSPRHRGTEEATEIDTGNEAATKEETATIAESDGANLRSAVPPRPTGSALANFENDERVLIYCIP